MNYSFAHEFFDLTRFDDTKSFIRRNNSKFYEVLDKRTNNKYLLLKFYKFLNDFNRNEIISLSQELNTLSQVMHPSILKFVGYSPVDFIGQPRPIIITEFPSNKTLGEIIELERKGEGNPFFDETIKLIIIYGITAGMSFLHSNNILHRDLKPENIFLDDKFHPKISGFFLSNYADQINTELVGTPVYLAPEILLSRKYSKKSDIYAFSLILYEILTNEKPFDDSKDVYQLFEEIKINSIRPKFNKKIPLCYKNLIEKCWSQEPQERPSFDEILNILTTDSNFINDQINKEEFFKYVEFINSTKSSFDKEKRIHHIEHIINTQLQFFTHYYNYSINDKYSTIITPVILNDFAFDFSDFEKHEKIGEGSYGKVFKIVNKKTGITYAAKEGFSSNFQDNLKSYLGVITALSNVKFPSIMQYIGFNFYNIKNKPKPTFIMEYASNGSLQNILEIERKGEKVKEWNDTKKLITIYGIAAAINCLHRHNIIHRDIKPNNILFDDYLFPKLSDFSIARIIFNKEEKEESATNNVPAEPEYIAPEVITHNFYSNGADIYSFGMVFYEIITGEKPFKELKNPIDIVNEVTQNNKRPEFNKPIPDYYRKLIESCWDINPIQRPGSFEITDFLESYGYLFSEDINKDEFYDYVDYIHSSKIITDFDKQSNMPKFIKKEKTKEYSFQKFDIYQNRPKEYEKQNLLINVSQIELNKFEINKQVGNGSFGTVYKVKDKETGEYYAAKISRYDIDRCSEDIVTNFEREVNVISELKHPSIMRFIGFSTLNFKYKRKPTIITEFVTNGSLEKIIELERMSIGIHEWDDTKKLINIFGIASGLSYMHSLNILHRDLKPANILLDNHLFPKISDFGLSKQLFEENIQHQSGFKGTCAYTAPEVFECKYSKSGDVYSFALIVYEIMTNEILFPKFNQYQLMTEVRKGLRPPFKYPIPTSYKKLITDCWKDNPEQRPTFDEIVYRLKNDHGFITENVEEKEFFNYVEFIEEFYNSKEEAKQTTTFKTITFDTNKFENIEQEELSENENFLDLSKYEKLNLISKGDFYKIYKVQNKETGDFYQGKISMIQINRFSRDELINLSHEVNIISKLNHPTFMKFIGYSPIDFKNQRKPVILTEFSINDSLKKILEIERTGEIIVGWNDTKKLINIYGIASAMSYLHSNNIIHRDLQPSNIFLDDYLFPKIGDFGLSKRIHNLETITYQTTSEIKGSPVYSSPEILQFNEYSKSGDVYAFGLIVYEILTNEIPFKNFKNTNEIYNEVVIKSNRPEIPKSMQDCYRSLIEKCWSQDANERPSFDSIVEHLKNNSKFITKEISKEDFINYIEFIGKSQLDFDFSHKVLQIDEFIKSKSKISEENEDEKDYDNVNKNDENSKEEKEQIKDKISEENIEEKEQIKDKISEENIKEKEQIKDKISEENIKEKEQIKDKISEENIKEKEQIKVKILEENANETKQINDEISEESVDEKEQVNVTNLEESNDKKIDDISKEKESLFLTDDNHVKLSKNQLINEYIKQKEPQKLMEYLNNECDNDLISTIFDYIYFENASFYSKLCQEGIKLNNAVAHHKYAVSLIFSKNDQDSIEQKRSKVKEAQSHLEESIRQGYNKSYFLLSRILHEFFHDDEQALEKAKEGSQKGDKYSQCLFGYYICKGIGIEKDHQKGVSIILESEADEYYELFSTDIGLYYINKIKEEEKEETIDIYKEKAFEYFEKAFKMNKTKATINNYGICFLIGIGVPKDIDKAKEVFLIGASMGDTNSKYHLGFIYEETNPEESLKYYKEAANEGHPKFQYSYHNKEQEESNKFSKNATEQRHSNSQSSYAFLDEEKEPNISNEYLSKSTKQMNIKSIEHLAQKYSIENDTENTFNFMNILTKTGNYNTPIEYALNLYKKKYFKEAFNYFSYLSTINHPIAKYFIGVMKFKGQGCEKNVDESFSILKELSEKGIERATEFIENHF